MIISIANKCKASIFAFTTNNKPRLPAQVNAEILVQEKKALSLFFPQSNLDHSP